MVLLAAYRIGKDALPDYAHRFSPKKFTQPQLLACLVLKAFWKTDYRGVCCGLEDLPDLRTAIGLRRVPHFTTLQKTAGRLLLAASAQALLESSIGRLMPQRKVPLAAVDSTGLEGHYVSSYFVRRRAKTPGKWQETTYRRYPKLGAVCDCRTHAILSTMTARGPTPDVHQMQRVVLPAARRVRIARLLADAGYDSEANHVRMREGLGIETIIPAKHGRPTSKLPTTTYRRLMAVAFDNDAYGQRWQIETVFSMIKRNLGEHLSARTYWGQCREMVLLALTHNVMILWRRLRAFLQSKPVPFCPIKSAGLGRRAALGWRVVGLAVWPRLRRLAAGALRAGAIA